jgi:hypothetical protein
MSGTAPRPVDRNARAALVAFVAALVAALTLYIVVGRHYWFFQDDWSFLAARDGGNLQSLLRPHKQHWSTVPVVIFRVLWDIFGLNTYRPYQLCVISLHLTAAVLLRIVMRRARVGPWIATVVAVMFLFLAGAAWQNIVWAFQIGFVGALVCGLAHMLLADHDGTFERRDAFGLVFGLVGLMCSGVAITMTFAVALAVLIRRGWRIAALHALPLAAVYLAWWASYGRDAYRNAKVSVGDTAIFVSTGISHAVGRIGRVPGTAALLWGVLVIGLVLAWGRLPREQLRKQAAAPAALLVAAIVFFIVGGLGRAEAFGTQFATRWRYVHIAVALLAPAFAVGADAIARRWKVAAPLLVVLFLVGIPRNVADLWPPHVRPRDDPLSLTGTTVVGNPRAFLTVAHTNVLRSAPRNTRPFTGSATGFIRLGWVFDNVDRGRIPHYEPTPAAEADATVAIALEHVRRDLSGTCTPFRPRTQRFQVGDTMNIDGTLLVRVRGERGAVSRVRGIGSFKVIAGPITLEMEPYGVRPLRECTGLASRPTGR